MYSVHNRGTVWTVIIQMIVCGLQIAISIFLISTIKQRQYCNLEKKDEKKNHKRCQHIRMQKQVINKFIISLITVPYSIILLVFDHRELITRSSLKLCVCVLCNYERAIFLKRIFYTFKFRAYNEQCALILSLCSKRNLILLEIPVRSLYMSHYFPCLLQAPCVEKNKLTWKQNVKYIKDLERHDDFFELIFFTSE